VPARIELVQKFYLFVDNEQTQNMNTAPKGQANSGKDAVSFFVRDGKSELIPILFRSVQGEFEK
jgi:hypothetical protein